MSLGLAAFITGMPLSVRAQEWGGGLHLVTAHIIRDSRRSGPALQPSAWVDVRPVRTLVSAWSSIRLRNPRIDDLVLDTRTGVPLGSWGWIGGTVHWDWTLPRSDSLASHSLEMGALFSWFTPPYRPTLLVSYDLINRDGLLAVISIPYTVRLSWMPPVTFIPEFGIRAGGEYDPVGLQYMSFTALIERRLGWLTVIPIAGVVPRGTNIREWLVWGGLHLGAIR